MAGQGETNRKKDVAAEKTIGLLRYVKHYHYRLYPSCPEELFTGRNTSRNIFMKSLNNESTRLTSAGMMRSKHAGATSEHEGTGNNKMMLLKDGENILFQMMIAAEQ